MAETGSEIPQRRGNYWLAALAVAACYGLSAFFVTGDTGQAWLLFLFVAAIFAALFLFAPRLVDTRKPLSHYYRAGLAVLIGPFLLLALGQWRTPWNDLAARYRTAQPEPAGLDAGDAIVLLQPVDEVMVKPHEFKGATTTFADQGVYLALSWPLSMVYDPLWLPVRAIPTCRSSAVDTMYTSLAVEGVAARVEVLDAAEDILDWCRERGIGDGGERPAGLLD